MGEEFDPYYRWLGIPPEERPPNHYRLLGLRALEPDAEIIRAAAEQRTAYLRTFQLSQQGPLAEKLLNEVSAARACLLNPARKAEYDQRLGEEAEPAGAEKNGVSAPGEPPPLPIQAAPGPPPVPPPVAHKTPSTPVPQWALTAVAVAALAAGVLLGTAILRWGRGPGDAGPVVLSSGQTEAARSATVHSPESRPEKGDKSNLPRSGPEGASHKLDLSPFSGREGLPRGQPDRKPNGKPEAKPEEAKPAATPGKPGAGSPETAPKQKPERPEAKPADAPPRKPEGPVEKPEPASDPAAEVDPAKVETAEKPQAKPSPPKPQPDSRIAQFRQVYEAVVPLYRDWQKLEKEAAPRRADLQTATVECQQLDQGMRQLQRQLQLLQSAYLAIRNDPDRADEAGNLVIRITAGQQQLMGLRTSLQRALAKRAGLQSEVRQFADSQAQLTAAADRHSRTWVSLCDPLGRLGPQTHQQTVKLMTAWIIEAPDVALPYVARGFSYVRLGQYARAMDDFDRAGQCDPRLAALVRAARGYALALQGDPRNSGVEFAAALKLDPKLALTHVFRGYAHIAQEKYTKAEAEFKLALRTGKNMPEVHDALAMLLAASPHESLRDGKKAVEHATAACELAQWTDWAYLSTLAAAYAQNGQFDRAIEWAGKALALAPPESGETLQKRLALYQARKPYRLK